jgi:hypothetical protein
VLIGEIGLFQFFEKARNIYALPALILLALIDPPIKLKIDRILLIFALLCILEGFLLVIGFGEVFRQYLDVSGYLFNKGTKVGYYFGAFGFNRLLTPMFQPSLGGVVIALTIIYFYVSKRYLISALLFVPLILTLSKTAFVMLLACFTIVISPFLTIFGAIASPFLLIDFLTEFGFSHTGSIRYHFKGFFEGFDFLLEPQGIGKTGTVGSIKGREVGAESGFGAFFAALGLFGLIPLLLFLSKKTHFIYVLFIVSVLFTEITLNMYVAAVFLCFVCGLRQNSNQNVK